MVKSTAKKPKDKPNNKLGITPLSDRVLIEIPTREEKTKGGIIIPESVDQEKPEQGKVIAVGEGRLTDAGKVVPVRVKIGDRVVFSKYGYDEISVDGNVYYMLKEDSILAVIN